MKFKKLVLVTCLLLAILTIGAVSATDYNNDTLTADDTQEDIIDAPVEEVTDDALSYEASDFNVEINESVDLNDEDAAAITYEVPDDAEGRILVNINGADESYVYNLDDSPITLKDLCIEKKGTYLIKVLFETLEDYNETELASGTMNVTNTITVEDFDTEHESSDEEYPFTRLYYIVFSLYDCPADGDLIVFVDNNKTYNVSLFREDDIDLTGSDLGITENGTHHILVKFITADNDEFPLDEFDAYYEIDDSLDIYTNYPYSNEKDPMTSFSDKIYWLEDCPVDGRLIIFVDNKEAYNVSVSKDEDVFVSGSDLGISEYGSYEIIANFTASNGKTYTLDEFDLYYNSPSFILINDVVDVSYYGTLIAFLNDDDSINGTVTLSIDGIECYNKKFNGTYLTSYIYDTDLEGITINKDFIGNYTVKVTYNDLEKESVVSFEFVPYIFYPYYVAAGEESYVFLKAASGSTGNASLYNSVKDEKDGFYSIGSLIGTYQVTGSVTNIPLPKLTEGYHIFFVNYTLNGKDHVEGFRIYAHANSENFTSSISSDEINVGDSVNVTVTGPKVGGVDIYIDSEFVGYFLLANGTVKHNFSDLAKGHHVIALSYDSEGGNDLFYSKFFGVTVKSGKPTVDYQAVDASTTTIYGELILTDITTGKVFKKNITVGPIPSKYSNASNADVSNNITETINQLLSIAQIQANGNDVTVKSQNVSNAALSRFDNRTYTWFEEDSNNPTRKCLVEGSYGTLWGYNVTVMAEYASPINITNATIVLSKNAFTFNNKVQKPTIKTIDGKSLIEGTDYTVQWSNPSSKNVGTYTVTVIGIGVYSGSAKATYKINKAANPLTVKGKTAKVSFLNLKKKAQTLAVSKVVTFSKKGQGTLTYSKVSGNSKITINKKTGKVTINKGLKKGTYNVKVKIKANGNTNYKPSAFKTVTFKIIVN